MRFMQLLYPAYKFGFIPVIPALGLIPTSLLQGNKRLDFTEKESNRIINVVQ